MAEVDIMNMALDLLEEEPIVSPNDNRPAARWLKRNFNAVLDGMLRSHPWNFATKDGSLAALSDAPVTKWKRQFALPPDCVRVLPLNDGQFGGRTRQFVVKGRRIYSDESAPLGISYIARPADLGDLDPLFVQAFTATLASRAASWITGKQSYSQLLEQRAATLMQQAQLIDALEGSAEDAESDDWVTGRSTGPGYDYGNRY